MQHTTWSFKEYPPVRADVDCFFSIYRLLELSWLG